MDSSQAFGLAHLWAQSDAIIRAVGVILLVMSISSWYLILNRVLRQVRARRNTTPVLVLRFEGHTPEALDRIEATMLQVLRTVKPDAAIEAAAH